MSWLKYPVRIIFVCCMISCNLKLHAQWENTGNPGVSDGWTMYNDIAVDSADMPVIVYKQTSSNSAHCLKFDGTDWTPVGPSSFIFPIGGNHQLKINPINNDYYLFFYDSSNSYLSCIKYNGINWSYAGSQYLATEVLTDYTVAFDNNGAMYCAFYGSSGLVLAHENGATWQIVNTFNAPLNMAWLSLVFDRQNNPVLAYTDMNDLKANVIKLTGNTWQSLGNSDISTGYAQYIKLVVTVHNEMFLAFHDNLIQCFRLDSLQNLWQQVGTAGLDGNYSFIDDFISDYSGKIYISTSQMGSSKARCITFNDFTWVETCGSSISDTTATYVNIAKDKQGTIYSIYNDYIIGKAYVKKCSSINTLNESYLKKDFTVQPNPAANNFQISTYGFDNIKALEVRNMTGRLIFSKQLSTDVFTIDINEFNNGIYLIILEDEVNRVIKKAVVNN